MKVKTFNFKNNRPKTEDIDVIFDEEKIGVINILLNNNSHKIEMAHLLSLRALDSKSDNDIMLQLESISTHLFTLGTSESQLVSLLKVLKRELEEWIAQNSDKVQHRLSKNASQKRVISEILNVSELKSQFESMQELIEKYEEWLSILKMYQENLKLRIDVLRSILRRREQIKGNKGQSHGI